MADADDTKTGHTLTDHLLGRDYVHEHDGDADHDHDHYDFDVDERLEDNPIWIQDHVTLVTVGIDIGSSGTQVIFSRINLRRYGEDLTSRYYVVSRETLFQSPVALTPYSDEERIDDAALAAIIDGAYAAAGVKPDDIDTGVVILTGEALRRENAQAIAGLLAEQRGDFVTATAGHHMESMLAAYGSGASKVSYEQDKRVLNVDIGGGTTKLALVEKGDVVATAAVHIGGRLQVVDEIGRIVRLDPAGRYHARQAGFFWSRGDVLSPAQLDKVAESMADYAGRGAAMRRCRHAVAHLYLTDPIADLGRIDGVMFSGGVGEYVYGRETRDFGDMGRRLGAAIRRRSTAGALPWPLLPAGECIRATALGASEYSVQLSGNTSYISKPGTSCCRAGICRCCSRPSSARRRSTPAALAEAIRAHFTAFDLVEGEGEVALALRWQGAPSYERIAAFAEGIRRGLAATIERRKPIYIMLDGDIAQTLGAISARGAAGRERDPGHRWRGAARFRLHRSRPHPHAVLHRAGDDQVAAVQRGRAPRPPAQRIHHHDHAQAMITITGMIIITIMIIIITAMIITITIITTNMISIRRVGKGASQALQVAPLRCSAVPTRRTACGDLEGRVGRIPSRWRRTVSFSAFARHHGTAARRAGGASTSSRMTDARRGAEDGNAISSASTRRRGQRRGARLWNVAVTAAAERLPPAPAITSRLDSRWLLIGLPVLLVAWLALVPLVFLLWQSVLTPQTAAEPAQWTLENFRAAYGSADNARLLLNSLQFATGAALLALVIGTGLAWMNERTNTPCKTLFFALSLIPLVIPGILFTVAWIMLASPKIGLVNLAFQGLLDTDAVLVDIYSMAGMIWVDGLHYSPMAFLLMTAAFRSMDPALEEQAAMSGASVAQVAGRITLKLAGPAMVGSLLILFVRAIELFEVPALLGLPVGIHVYTSSIYQAIHEYPSRIGLAAAYAMTLLVITALGIYVQSRVSDRGARFATVTGKGFRPRTIDLGRWRYLTAAIFILYFVVIVLLPFLVLLWSSTQRFYSRAVMGRVRPHEPRFLSRRARLSAVRRHGAQQPGAGGGSRHHVMLVSAVIAWVVVRTKMPGRCHARPPGVAAAGVPGDGARARDHGLLSHHRHRRLRHAVDHADRLCHALSSLRHALQHRLDAADPRGAGGVRRR